MSRRVGLKHEQFNTNTQTRIDTWPAHVGREELSRAHPRLGTFVTLLIIVFTTNLATTSNTLENNQGLTRPGYLLSPPTPCPVNEASSSWSWPRSALWPSPGPGWVTVTMWLCDILARGSESWKKNVFGRDQNQSPAENGELCHGI